MANNNYAPDKTHTHRQEKKQESKNKQKRYESTTNTVAASKSKLVVASLGWLLDSGRDQTPFIFLPRNCSGCALHQACHHHFGRSRDSFQSHMRSMNFVTIPRHTTRTKLALNFCSWISALASILCGQRLFLSMVFFFGLATCDKYFSPFQEVIVVAQTEPVEKSCFPSFRR